MSNSNFAIVEEREVEQRRIVTVDTTKANYQGQPWRTLGDYGKRRFENLIFLTWPTERVYVIYQ